jgi:hypothetical protein
VIFQVITPDAEELAPEFANKVEATEKRREAELVISPHPVEDIWEHGHSNEVVMEVRNMYFWIVDLLKKNPHEKYFESKEGWNKNVTASYRSSADMLREGITLLNQYLFAVQTGKNTIGFAEIFPTLLECWGGVLGLFPTMDFFIPDEKRARLLYLLNEKRKQEHEQAKRDYEQKKRDLIQEQRDKIQAIKDKIQNITTHGIRLTNMPLLKNQHLFKSLPDGTYAKATDKEYQAQERYLYSLSQQILTLEQNPLSLPPSPFLQTINTLPEKYEDIEKLAIEAGMTFHEIENLIEWRNKPLTLSEQEALYTFIDYHIRKQQTTEEEVTAIENGLSINRNQLAIIQAFFILLFLLVPCLKEKPIKIPSGHYDEALKVERTQQDLINEMAIELGRLPRFNAYYKIIEEREGRQRVLSGEMQTLPLPKETFTGDLIGYTKGNGYNFCKEREAIEAEIYERQEKWRRVKPPPQNTPPDTPPREPPEEPPPPTRF